jgi:hypothetical protein
MITALAMDAALGIAFALLAVGIHDRPLVAIDVPDGLELVADVEPENHAAA